MRVISLFLLTIFIIGCGASSVTTPKNPNILTSFTGCAIGAFVNGMNNLPTFQSTIGRNLAVVLIYAHWQDAFPTSDADTIYNNGSVPLITWEPWITNQIGTLESIAAGSYESYVTQFIQDAKDWGGPVLLRFAHEMNGNWYPWDGYHNGASLAAAERYKNAWIYICNVKERLNADNVSLVWTPNNANLPDASWNLISNYYPGDQYVDWIGMDGYNWGVGDWKSFSSVFGPIYQELIALSSKPLMIGEFASAEQGGDKANWITDAFSQIQNNYPRVKIFCWFNINKERDWRINSSSSSETAANQSLQSSYFLDTIRSGN
jgi:beta-mannanase